MPENRAAAPEHTTAAPEEHRAVAPEHKTVAPVKKTTAPEKKTEEKISDTDLMSYLMYPDVFSKFAAARTSYSDLDVLPTPAFFYGLKEGEEVTIDLEPGKTLILRFLTVGDARADGMRTVFFELNGQPREVEIRDKSIKDTAAARRKADPAKAGEVGAPIPGAVTTLHVKPDQTVKEGEPLLVMEAMKMQTSVYAPISGTVKEIAVKLRDSVEARDLLLVIE